MFTVKVRIPKTQQTVLQPITTVGLKRPYQGPHFVYSKHHYHPADPWAGTVWEGYLEEKMARKAGCKGGYCLPSLKAPLDGISTLFRWRSSCSDCTDDKQYDDGPSTVDADMAPPVPEAPIPTAEPTPRNESDEFHTESSQEDSDLPTNVLPGNALTPQPMPEAAQPTPYNVPTDTIPTEVAAPHNSVPAESEEYPQVNSNDAVRADSFPQEHPAAQTDQDGVKIIPRKENDSTVEPNLRSHTQTDDDRENPLRSDRTVVSPVSKPASAKTATAGPDPTFYSAPRMNPLRRNTTKPALDNALGSRPAGSRVNPLRNRSAPPAISPFLQTTFESEMPSRR